VYQFCTLCPKKGVSREPDTGGAVMMNRPVKLTPQVLENIKELLAQGIKRDEIAKRVGVTVRSVQVTCSRLGITVGTAHVRKKEVSQSATRRAEPE
jgi:DNA-binding NarL/FixJ family response regulator